ncbi:MAG: hypothetical protein R2880_08805 [Deinococcales bacterium]
MSLAKKLFSQLFSLYLLFLSTSCTGSFENLPKSFLIVAYGDKLAVLDTELLNNDTPSNDRKLFATTNLPATSQSLSYDIVNRRSDRSGLMVLSRNSENKNLSYISFFDISQISTDPNAPTSSLPRSEARSLSYARGEASDSPLQRDYACPSKLQLSKNGRYVVLLHDQSLCTDDDSLFDHIDIIDLNSKTIVYDYTLHLNVGEMSSIYLYQADRAIDEDTLYFIDDVTGTKLFKLPMNTNFTETSILDLEAAMPNINLKDLAPMGTDLITLAQNELNIIQNYHDTPEVGEKLSLSQGLGLIANELSADGNIYLLSETQLIIFFEAKQASNDRRSLSAVGGSLDSSAFIYLLSNSRISRFDSALYNPGNIEIFSYDIFDETGKALSNSHFITWITQLSNE